jgi:hypothetical protein
MQIKITTTLDISEENKPLIPLVSNDIGYEQWRLTTINDAREKARTDNVEFNADDLDVSSYAFIKAFLSLDYTQRLKNIISPVVDKYFGIVMQTQAAEVRNQLNEAITTEVLIID